MGRNYNVEAGELEREYKNWQRKLHPDLVHSKTQREREYVAEQPALVIDAYRALADQLSRAIYMMTLEGLIVDEEERITDLELLDLAEVFCYGSELLTSQPVKVLLEYVDFNVVPQLRWIGMQIMELREAVEETEGTEALIQIQAQWQEKLQYWSNSFEDAFRSKRYEDDLSSIRRLTYYKRTNEEIIKKL